jgi:hypothetical protein
MEWDVNHSGSDEIDQRIRERSVWRLSRLRALAPPGLNSDDGADLVVACLMGELDFAERFQEWRQVHPRNDRDSPCGGHIIRRPGCPRSDPKLRRCLPWRALLIGGTRSTQSPSCHRSSLVPSGIAGIVADSCWASRPVPDSNRLKKAADCSRGDERHPGARNSAVNLGASRR